MIKKFVIFVALLVSVNLHAVQNLANVSPQVLVPNTEYSYNGIVYVYAGPGISQSRGVLYTFQTKLSILRGSRVMGDIVSLAYNDSTKCWYNPKNTNSA